MDTAPLRERALACESHHEYRHFYCGSTTESSEFSAIQDHAVLRGSRVMCVRELLGQDRSLTPGFFWSIRASIPSLSLL